MTRTLEHDGWIRLDKAPPGVDALHVLAHRDGGRWVVTGICMHGQNLTADSLRRGISLARIEALLNRPAADSADREHLCRPDGTDPDRFYSLVASAYRAYATESNAVSKAIANEAGVPVTTAHRWVREARRRGFLPAGRKGRAG